MAQVADVKTGDNQLDGKELGFHNAIWDDGEWVSWSSIKSHLERLELQARFPNADVTLIPIFKDLLETAQHFHIATGKQLNIYGDIGELYGAITYGIKLHRNYAQGSDGRLGDDFVEIKTITPFKKNNKATVRLDRHFSKLLVVKINEWHAVSGVLVDRKRLPRNRGKYLRIGWNALMDLE